MQYILRRCTFGHTVLVCVLVGLHARPSYTLDLTTFSWASIELVDGRVSATSKVECFKLTNYVNPLLALQLEDGGGSADDSLRTITFTIVKHNTTHWTMPSSEPQIVYYQRNATLSARLIGHDTNLKEPMRSPSVLFTGAHTLTLPLDEPYKRVFDTLSGECFNVTVAIMPLYFTDFMPTTTVDPYIDYNMIKYDAARAQRGAAITPMPLWLAVCGGILIVTLSIGFMLLLAVHLRTRRRHMHSGIPHKLTIQHQTTATMKTNGCGGGGYAVPIASATGTGNTMQHRNSIGTTPPSSMGARSSSVESHYDVPWDQKFRPLPDWLRTELQQSIQDGHAQTVAVRPVACPQPPTSCRPRDAHNHSADSAVVMD